jgi:hypothetical protein
MAAGSFHTQIAYCAEDSGANGDQWCTCASVVRDSAAEPRSVVDTKRLLDVVSSRFTQTGVYRVGTFAKYHRTGYATGVLPE